MVPFDLICLEFYMVGVSAEYWSETAILLEIMKLIFPINHETNNLIKKNNINK